MKHLDIKTDYKEHLISTDVLHNDDWLARMAPYRGDFDTNLSLEDIKNQELL